MSTARRARALQRGQRPTQFVDHAKSAMIRECGRAGCTIEHGFDAYQTDSYLGARREKRGVLRAEPRLVAIPRHANVAVPLIKGASFMNEGERLKLSKEIETLRGASDIQIPAENHRCFPIPLPSKNALNCRIWALCDAR